MKLRDALGGVATLGIETAPFIYFVEKHSTYVDRMRAIFQLVDSGTPQVITSAITLTEVLVMPIHTGQTQYEQEYRAMLPEHLTHHDLAGQCGHCGAGGSFARAVSFAYPDAIHIATAMIAGCDAFLTNDLDLKRVQEIRVLVLDDLS